jgi:predicted DCC family thiol-disulfide oxidoreductase YuxK
MALLSHYGIDPADPESWLFFENGRAWISFDAWINAGQSVGGIGNVMRIFWIVPRPVRDWIYRRVARNRIALFGRADMCTLPDDKLRAKLIGTM